MSSRPASQPPDPTTPLADRTRARGDFLGALAWVGLGLAILIGSLTMDRLESQHINPHTAPGLLPGLLGVAMMLLGSLLALRSWRRGALRPGPTPGPAPGRLDFGRLSLVLALCLGFGVGLVGRGLPFWLAAAVFVTIAIIALQHPQRKAERRKLSVREVLVAAAIGLGAGGAITLVFQQFFLVRLP
jgi:hypothetical protein